jgi:hypothetical protein
LSKKEPHQFEAGAVLPTTAPSLEPAGMLRIAVSQMAWKGCAAVRTHLRAGAKANRSLKLAICLLALRWWLTAGCGRSLRGFSHPLRSRPRLSRIPFQATSGVGGTLFKIALTQENTRARKYVSKMNSIQIFFESLKLLATIGVGLIAAYIALKQSQINARKLRFDLYEKRLRIFREIVDYIRIVVSDLEPKINQLQEFYLKTNESTFLFKQDVVDYLDLIYKNAVRLRFLTKRIDFINRPDAQNQRAEDFNKLNQYSEEHGDLSIWFSNQMPHVKNLFKPYMSFVEMEKQK